MLDFGGIRTPLGRRPCTSRSTLPSPSRRSAPRALRGVRSGQTTVRWRVPRPTDAPAREAATAGAGGGGGAAGGGGGGGGEGRGGEGGGGWGARGGGGAGGGGGGGGQALDQAVQAPRPGRRIGSGCGARISGPAVMTIGRNRISLALGMHIPAYLLKPGSPLSSSRTIIRFRGSKARFADCISRRRHRLRLSWCE